MKPEIQALLLSSAATSLDFALDHNAAPTTNPKRWAADYPELQELGRTFVSIYRKGKMCGCIGSIDVIRNVWEDVKINTVMAAFTDVRFAPVHRWQLPYIKIGISPLYDEIAIPRDRIEEEIKRGRGILLRLPQTKVKSILLPYAVQGKTEEQIITILRNKASLNSGVPTEQLSFFSVGTEYFEDEFTNIKKLGE